MQAQRLIRVEDELFRLTRFRRLRSKPSTQAERLDLLELIDDRYGRRSTLVTSQLPIAHWHAHLGEDPTVADALLDRLLSAAHRLELKGESLRKRQKQNGKELDAERAKQ